MCVSENPHHPPILTESCTLPGSDRGMDALRRNTQLVSPPPSLSLSAPSCKVKGCNRKTLELPLAGSFPGTMK